MNSEFSNNQSPLEVDIEVLRSDFKRIREQRRLSQQDAGTLLGMSQGFVSSFEKGKYQKARPSSLRKIWRQLGVWKGEPERIDQGKIASHGVILGFKPRSNWKGKVDTTRLRRHITFFYIFLRHSIEVQP